MGNPHNSLPDIPMRALKSVGELSYIPYVFDTLARGVELAFTVPGVSFSFGMPFLLLQLSRNVLILILYLSGEGVKERDRNCSRVKPVAGNGINCSRVPVQGRSETTRPVGRGVKSGSGSV
ncbi:hypothetical protein SDJN03_18697, partial [Cucurbita argyrosperma subsp. sororia]